LAIDESALLKRAREYDTQALAEIYDRYAELIYRYLYRYLGNAELAEDMTSEVFLRLLQVLGTAKAPRDQIGGWLYRVAHNLAMDWFRQQAKESSLSLDEELVAGDDSPSTRLEEDQRQQRLREAISQLTPSQQQVIVLRFAEGLKLGEIGQLLSKSEGSVKLIQYRAIRRLRKLLDHEEKKRNDKKRSRSV
jgi:RNA polymerase sigma-70 factor (ECF subfamily)